MFETNDTFETAMLKVAERLLLARSKQAATPEQVLEANSARQSLGVLGADPAKIDSAVAALRRGATSPRGAMSQIRGSVPSAMSQLANVPSAIGTAIQQGRPDEAAAQADVLGAKNISPFARNFSPATVAASAGLGLGTVALRRHIETNLQDRKNFYHPDVAGLAPYFQPKQIEAWKRWRQSSQANTAEHSWLAKARDAVAGVPIRRDTMDRFRSVAADKAKATAGKTPGAPQGFGAMASRAALPLAAASLPLLYREWAGRGYRSGQVPAEQLVNATNSAPEERR